MSDIIQFIKRNGFMFMVFISLCIISYFMIGKNLSRSSSVNIQDDPYIPVGSNQLEISENSDWNKEMVSVHDTNSKTPFINTVKLADQKKDEQTIVLEDNSKLTGTDVVLVEKNKKANWVFRFSNGKACNGRISIEGFGTIIPVMEKEMVISFVPSKDFTIICDQGKFNYYIKVVDNLNTALNITKIPATNQNSGVNNKSSSKTSSVISNPATPTTTESSMPTLTNNEAASIPPEEPKQGILDHIFHHNH